MRLLKQFGADTAQLDGCDTEVGSNMVLRDLLFQAGIFLAEDQVIGRGIVRDHPDIVPLFVYPFLLKNYPKKRFEASMPVKQYAESFKWKFDDAAVRQRLKVQFGRTLGQERRQCCREGARAEKSLVVFIAVLVVKDPDDAFKKHKTMISPLAFHHQKIIFGHDLSFHQRLKRCPGIFIDRVDIVQGII